ncbi:glycosyltransferase [Limimaricola pyoseonensis]|uniref:Chitooligosaccharide deacetylase n=1 Tax=Limimaricola pyoseonensis TaxID=521013 RepID=A0A1G7IHL2_9RHOB|nr:glycosyltransferase [Limimaricola pyoseonensis]SDF12182.1 Glycosyltransferase, catalytic subunit of cellulose synthase and poly-beta-1,6-N-acetylglucosamine synthase [Limimaricola pyoseonensis]
MPARNPDFVVPRVLRGLPAAVFSAPNSQRGVWLRRLALAASILFAVWAALFFIEIWNAGRLASVSAPQDAIHPPGLDAHVHLHGLEPPSPHAGGAAWQPASQPSTDCPEPGTKPRRPVFAFAPSSSPHAPFSLERDCGLIDVLLPEWATLEVLQDAPRLDMETEAARMPMAQAAPRGTAIWPVVNVTPGYLAAFVRSPGQLEIEFEALAAEAHRQDWPGYCLDFTALVGSPLSGRSALLREWMRLTRANGMERCTIFPANTEAALLQIAGRTADFVIAKGFQEPWIGTAPTALAGRDWFASEIGRVQRLVPEDQLVVALGAGAVLWHPQVAQPERVGFAHAMTELALADGRMSFSPEAGNSFANWRDETGGRVRAWLLDLASFDSQLRALESRSDAAVAVWGLGLEDPAIWPRLAGASDAALTRVYFDSYVHQLGEGPFVRPGPVARHGVRQITRDPVSNEITEFDYKVLPRAALVELYGRGRPDQIVLTFDDGPDPRHTPAILDALKEKGVPASFFVLGQSVAQSPQILRRILREGHEIGSHSYWHPKMSAISETRARLEINSTQLAIGTASGVSARLYREPYMRSGGPIHPAELATLRPLHEAGYVIAGIEVVPWDWTASSPEALTDEVIAQIAQGAGNVVLLHDSGGDKSVTVAAVPMIIDRLRAQGYEFTTLAGLLNTPAYTLMPTAPALSHSLHGLSFQVLGNGWTILAVGFWTTFAIGVSRSVLLLVAARLRRRHVAPLLSAGDSPTVAIVVPAYNEARVITQCVSSALASAYDRLEVIVVDDGSTDGTAEIARAASADPRLQVIRQANGGKASALNTAIAESNAEIFVCLDADSQVDPYAVARLARHFRDPEVGAVSGKVVVGNRTNWLTGLQALEYITAQGIERRARERFNAMPVVPGALGAWRATAVLEAGIYSSETLAEDADLTMSVIRSGYRVVYDENAIVTTEAPSSLSQLMTQRLRWSLGMLQASWKHRGAWRDGPALGVMTLPDLALSGYLLPLLAPLADAFLVIHLWSWLQSDGTVQASSMALIGGYALLPLLEVAMAAAAFRFDPSESRRLLLLLPLQRLIYRPILYYCVYRALGRAASGRLAKWGRMQREGSMLIAGLRRA